MLECIEEQTKSNSMKDDEDDLAKNRTVDHLEKN